MAVEQAVPPDWASRTPGPHLAAALEQLDLPAVPDDQIVPVLQAPSTRRRGVSDPDRPPPVFHQPPRPWRPDTREVEGS